MGVLTDFFLATEGELRAYYPGWRVPLAEPVRARMKNPFTGEMVESVNWDPDPENPVEYSGGRGPPSPSIDMKGLDLASVCTLMGIMCTPAEATEESFYRSPLLGPEDGPWINELPPPFVAKLASLDADGLTRVAATWTEVERADIAAIGNEHTRTRGLARRDLAHWRASLDMLVPFARLAVEQRRGMFIWTCL